MKLLRKIKEGIRLRIGYTIKKLFNYNLFSRTESSKSFNYYMSSLPDRYSFNFKTYKQRTNFLNYADLNKWVHGNFANNIGDISRFFFLNLCIDYLIEENIAGNVAELGVYKGNSAFLIARYAERVNSTCYLFDTFEGFDPRDIQCLDSSADKKAFLDTSVEKVKEIVGEKNIVYVKGYFPDSLIQIGELQSFSLVHIDCDLENPVKAALEYFYPKMVKGGFLIMHDHSSLLWVGAKNAIDNFFRDKNESIIPVPDKSGSCVIRKT
jgi:hypothetical protein